MFRTFICLLACLATPLSAHEIEYPIYTGSLHVTAENDRSFLDFANTHIGKIVYLDIEVTYSFGREDDYAVNAACNAENDFWNDGFSNNRFDMPLEIRSAEDIACAEIPITFSGLEIPLSSGGPGAHWYEIQGFFLMRERVDRWPFIEFQWLEADAETWALITN